MAICFEPENSAFLTKTGKKSLKLLKPPPKQGPRRLTQEQTPLPPPPSLTPVQRPPSLTSLKPLPSLTLLQPPPRQGLRQLASHKAPPSGDTGGESNACHNTIWISDIGEIVRQSTHLLDGNIHELLQRW